MERGGWLVREVGLAEARAEWEKWFSEQRGSTVTSQARPKCCVLSSAVWGESGYALSYQSMQPLHGHLVLVYFFGRSLAQSHTKME